MNQETETFNATAGFALLPVAEGLGMRACKVEQTIASNMVEILSA
jgi:hypothetical protein